MLKLFSVVLEKGSDIILPFWGFCFMFIYKNAVISLMHKKVVGTDILVLYHIVFFA